MLESVSSAGERSPGGIELAIVQGDQREVMMLPQGKEDHGPGFGWGADGHAEHSAVECLRPIQIANAGRRGRANVLLWPVSLRGLARQLPSMAPVRFAMLGWRASSIWTLFFLSVRPMARSKSAIALV